MESKLSRQLTLDTRSTLRLIITVVRFNCSTHINIKRRPGHVARNIFGYLGNSCPVPGIKTGVSAVSVIWRQRSMESRQLEMYLYATAIPHPYKRTDNSVELEAFSDVDGRVYTAYVFVCGFRCRPRFIFTQQTGNENSSLSCAHFRPIKTCS